jgi:hypothetical protein
VAIRVAAVRQLLQQIPAGRGSRADQPAADDRDHRDGTADAGIFAATDPEVLETGVTQVRSEKAPSEQALRERAPRGKVQVDRGCLRARRDLDHEKHERSRKARKASS